MIFAGVMSAVVFYMDLTFVKSSAYHDLYVSHISFQRAQHKLTTVHLELQKALGVEIQETKRIEEFRSFVDIMFGDLTNELKDKVLVEEKDLIDEIISRTETKTVRRLDELIRNFKQTKTIAQKRLEQLSSSVLEDIELSEQESRKFRERQKMFKSKKEKLTEKERIRMKLQDIKEIKDKAKAGFGHIDNRDADILTKNLEKFYENLETLDFPLINPNVVRLWEKRHQQVLKQLDDDNTATDLNSYKNFINVQLSKNAPEFKIDSKVDDESYVALFEKIIMKAKLMPHKQELQDMNEGWKSGNLNVYQVLANIEQVASVEQITIFDMFQ